MNQEVLDYIRANRLTYTREAINRQLREEGFAAADIEAAWKVIQREDALAEQEPPTRQTSSDAGCWLAALGLVLLVVGIALLALTNLGLGLSSGNTGSLLWFVNLGTMVVLAAVAVVGTWLSSQKGWSAGKVTGLVIAVTLVWYLVVLGTCLYGPRLLSS